MLLLLLQRGLMRDTDSVQKHTILQAQNDYHFDHNRGENRKNLRGHITREQSLVLVTAFGEVAIGEAADIQAEYIVEERLVSIHLR